MITQVHKNLDPRAARTRERLDEAMLTLLSKQPLEEISVTEIVAEAGIGYATFFRHYPDKHELWRAATESLIHELNIRIAPLMETADHHAAALEICRFVADHREVYRMLLAGGSADATREVMLRDTLAVAEGLPSRELIGLPPTLGSHFAVNAIFAILAWWLGGHEDVPAGEVAEYLDRLVFVPMFERD